MRICALGVGGSSDCAIFLGQLAPGFFDVRLELSGALVGFDCVEVFALLLISEPKLLPARAIIWIQSDRFLEMGNCRAGLADGFKAISELCLNQIIVRTHSGRALEWGDRLLDLVQIDVTE